MVLIKCPECGKEISDKSNQCIHCGCPINKSKYQTYAIYLKNIKGANKSERTRNLMICKVVLEDCYGVSKLDARHITVEFNKGVSPIKILDGVEFKNIEYIKKDFERIGCIVEEKESGYINEITNYRVDQQKEINSLDDLPKCPTCGSTYIEKISSSSKITSGFLFGLFSSNVRNSFHCKNCGYKW